MQNNSSNDLLEDIMYIFGKFGSLEQPAEDFVINEHDQALLDDIMTHKMAQNFSLTQPMMSCAMAPLSINSTDLKLTEGRKAILLEDFTPFIPPGEKYDLIRRAHYQAMLKVLRIERAPDFETKPLAEQRAIVKEIVDDEIASQLFGVNRKIDVMQKLAIMKGDEIHPEIVAVAAEWSDD